jgi:hypothetical protein
VNKISAAAAIAASSATLLGAAIPAVAAPDPLIIKPTITATPSSVYQGGMTMIHAACRSKLQYPVVTSPISEVVRGKAGKSLDVVLNVQRSVTPGTYTVTVRCHRLFLPLPGPANTTSLTVLKWTAPTPPPPPKPKPEPHNGDVVVVIDTGLGGMASAVAHHHPRG